MSILSALLLVSITIFYSRCVIVPTQKSEPNVFWMIRWGNATVIILIARPIIFDGLVFQLESFKNSRFIKPNRNEFKWPNQNCRMYAENAEG